MEGVCCHEFAHPFTPSSCSTILGQPLYPRPAGLVRPSMPATLPCKSPTQEDFAAALRQVHASVSAEEAERGARWEAARQ